MYAWACSRSFLRLVRVLYCVVGTRRLSRFLSLLCVRTLYCVVGTRRLSMTLCVCVCAYFGVGYAALLPKLYFWHFALPAADRCCVCVRGVAILCARRRQRTERIVAGRLGNEIALAALLCRWPFVTSLPMVLP